MPMDYYPEGQVPRAARLMRSLGSTRRDYIPEEEMNALKKQSLLEEDSSIEGGNSASQGSSNETQGQSNGLATATVESSSPESLSRQEIADWGKPKIRKFLRARGFNTTEMNAMTFKHMISLVQSLQGEKDA